MLFDWRIITDALIEASNDGLSGPFGRIAVFTRLPWPICLQAFHREVELVDPAACSTTSMISN